MQKKICISQKVTVIATVNIKLGSRERKELVGFELIKQSVSAATSHFSKRHWNATAINHFVDKQKQSFTRGH